MFRVIVNSGIPSDIIPGEAITIDEPNQKVTIDLKKMLIPHRDNYEIWIPEIPSTGSMKPTFGAGNNNIYIKPKTDVDKARFLSWISNEVDIGKDNVVTYYGQMGHIVHRLIQKGSDRLGTYFKFRGDKNLSADPEKVRESQIQYLSIGSIF